MQAALTVIRQSDRPEADFGGGTTYLSLIADDTAADLPIRTGVQTSAPGYATRLHSHPYAEILTVLQGRGEAWLEDEPGTVTLEPGITIVIPAGRRHGFRTLGEAPLVTYGIHCNPARVVHYADTAAT